MSRADQLRAIRRAYGTSALAWRALYEGAAVTGLRAWLAEHQRPPILTRPPTHLAWREALPPHHWLVRMSEWVERGHAGDTMRALLTDAQREALVARAEAATRGTLRMFHADTLDVGWPIDWHVTRPTTPGARPTTRWPAEEHASRVMRHAAGCGDIKWPWEVGRFGFVYDWTRAYALDRDPKWARAFAESVASFEEANPYGQGVHWVSGQELAIRSLAWIWGLSIFGSSEGWQDEDSARVMRLLELHAVHIAEHLGFARRASPNNHLIGEGLALYVIGAVFPYMRLARRWGAVGREILTVETAAQWDVDGGYIQRAHNYHRLALHYMLWAWHIARAQGDDCWRTWAHVLETSGAFLAAQQDRRTGMLPNLGELDGALICPWTECDFSDMRPLLQTLRWITSHRRAYAQGPWDEALLWFAGPEATRGVVDPWSQPPRKSFAASGQHVLRNTPEQLAVLRCGGADSMFGHADQLHVDLWYDGLNVACDPGSYLYNDETHVHRWMSGTTGHNTISVHGEDQRQRLRRFTWDGDVQARCDWRGGTMYGAHEAYRARFGVSILRGVRAEPGRWIVEDEVTVPWWNAREVALHWLLCDGDWSVEVTDDEDGADGRAWRLTRTPRAGTPGVVVTLRVSGARLVQVEAPQVMRGVDRGPRARGLSVDGWSSRRYGSREPALGVAWTVHARGALKFETEFCISC